jgi:type I restriction enzyme S subunit
MKLERFFEKFELFAEAPDAVARMREVVLELGVTGKLLRDNTSKWKKIDLGDVVELISGQHLLAHEHNSEERGMPYLTGPSDFGDTNPNPSRWTENPKVIAQPGDILITVKGSGVGKTNVLIDQPTAISRQLMAIRATGADPVFVHILLRRAAEHFQTAKTGIAIPGIGRRDVLSLNILLPPLAEQKQIVAKVDELMALCDQLEAQQQERQTRHAALVQASLARFTQEPTPTNLQFLFHPSYNVSPADLRKTILTLAVQGKLVPQDPNEEPAKELLARIERFKNELIKQRVIKRVSLAPNADENDFEALPPGWQWTRLGIAFDVRDGTHDTPKYTATGFPLITSKNLYSGKLLFENVKLISEKDHRQICERSRVDKGDILFAMIGSIGNPVIVDTYQEFSIKNVALFKYYSAADSEPFFLLLYLNYASEEMKAKAAGAVQSFVSLGFLRNYFFPLPPLAEQRRIVAKVDELLALVDELENQLVASRTVAQNLLAALVRELSTTP